MSVYVCMQVRAKTKVDYGSYTDVEKVTLPLELPTVVIMVSPELLSGGDKAAIVITTFAVLILLAVVSIIGSICYRQHTKKSQLTQ